MIRIRLRWPAASPMTRWVLLSVAGHALFISGVLLAPSLDARTRVPDHIVVELVPSLASSPQPPAPSRDTAVPSPPPEPARPEPVPVAPRKPPKKPLPTKPEKKKKEEPAPPAPEPEPRRAQPPTTGRDPAPGETAGAEVGDSRGGVAPLEAEDVQFAWYRSSVTAALHANWRKPPLEGVGAVYEVTVAFDILRDGSVRGLRIELPSRIPSLDRSAERAVRDAAPLPPLPRNWPENVLPARFVFRLYPD